MGENEASAEHIALSHTDSSQKKCIEWHKRRRGSYYCDAAIGNFLTCSKQREAMKEIQ